MLLGSFYLFLPQSYTNAMTQKLLCIILFISLALSVCMTGCLRHEPKAVSLASQEQDALMKSLNDSLAKNPSAVAPVIDSLLITASDSIAYYRLLLLKMRIKFFAFELDSFFLLFNQVDSYCERHQDAGQSKAFYASIYNMKGNVYARKALMDSACLFFEKAYEYAIDSEQDNLPDICLNLADANVRHGRYDLGAYWYRQALYAFDAKQVPAQERFPAYYGLGQVSMELRDFQACDYYYDLAKQFYASMKPYEKHIYLNNRGNSYYVRKDYHTALHYFRRSLALCNKHSGMEFERNLTMINLGEVFLLMHQVDSASFYLERCYDFFHSIKNNSALYYIDSQLIELALEQGDLQTATRRIREAVNPSYIEPGMVHSRNRNLQHYYEKAGDFKRAYYFQQENQRIDDSIRNGRVKMRAEEIALKYRQDSTLMKKELSIREKENQLLRLHQWLYGIVLSVLLLVAVATVLVLYFKRRRDREQWRLQQAITSLRLENIRNRISPHFIFNVLSREVNLQKEDSKSANLMGLIKLFRRNLEMTDSLAVTLSDELDFVETYINLEKNSLGDSFTYQLNIDKDLSLHEIYVPSMLLQIPVENAIKHGLRLKEGKRLLRISISRKDNFVEIVICDNGGGYHRKSANKGTGTGMKVITQTIQLLNSYNRTPIVMSIQNVPVEQGEMGCEIRFVLPLHYIYQLKKNIYGKDASGYHR